MGLIMLDRMKYSQQSCYCFSLWSWDSYRNAKKTQDHKVLIKFQQNWLKQEVRQFVLRSINLLILF